MADVSDVLDALQTIVDNSIYPTRPPVAGQAVTGCDVQIGVGWPDEAEITEATSAGKAIVSIYPLDGEKVSVEWEQAEQEVPRPTPGMTAQLFGNVISLAGQLNPNDVIGIVWEGKGYSVTATTVLNVSSTIAALAQHMGNAVQTTTANTLTLVPAYDIRVVVSNNGYSVTAVGSIERRIQFTIWSYDQPSRDKVFTALMNIIRRTSRFAVQLTAAETVTLRYSGATWSDKAQNAGAYMRTLIATAEFQTTVYDPAYAILFPDVVVNGIAAGIGDYTDTPILAVVLEIVGIYPADTSGNYLVDASGNYLTVD